MRRCRIHALPEAAVAVVLRHFIGEVLGAVAVLGEEACERGVGLVGGLGACLAGSDLGFDGCQFALEAKVFFVVAGGEDDAG